VIQAITLCPANNLNSTIAKPDSQSAGRNGIGNVAAAGSAVASKWKTLATIVDLTIVCGTA